MTHNKSTSYYPAPEFQEIESLLRSLQINPNDRLYKKISGADWVSPAVSLRPEGLEKIEPSKKYVRRIAYIFIILVFIFFLLVPSEHGLAQIISRFFKVAPVTEMTQVISLTPRPTDDPGYPYNLYSLTVAEAAVLAGFEIKFPMGTLDDWVFHGANYDEEKEKAELFFTIDYQGRKNYLYLAQMKSEFKNDWGQCPNGTIEHVMVNQWPAELAYGAVWTTYDKPIPGTEQEWVCEKVGDLVRTLRWEEDDLRYSVSITKFSEEFKFDRDDLIEVAESLK